MQIDATLQLEVMFPNDKKKIDVEISNFIAWNETYRRKYVRLCYKHSKVWKLLN
jgi:hypothetical protein